jgi:hypothetical protein
MRAWFSVPIVRGNPYQTITGWLQRHLSLTRGLD